ncbi:uncharacterized protein BO88DRAFT_402090 [Aspergillus vadensis CBS 113365]|uniref:Uncharacterized protein n=1 Tax=Aspergillus vadensis (strain CBS 113365 / IMI 142717 / IBT 24658) TaxID=1448311 RepID=A0A319BK19_ASPVC|nr:hypothetical protein BO88DRAFT_402090 [Aspergillus vadensis CBS 113365]PYH73037.1 hypothetical protein BO88DRAFT_402090 [Aspergillus vadensis CBS 113365]
MKSANKKKEEEEGEKKKTTRAAAGRMYEGGLDLGAGLGWLRRQNPDTRRCRGLDSRRTCRPSGRQADKQEQEESRPDGEQGPGRLGKDRFSERIRYLAPR